MKPISQALRQIRITVLLILFTSLFSYNLTSQSLIQELGGVRTSFIIFSLGEDFDVIAQYIILKGSKKVGSIDLIGDDGAHDFGYSSYFLEFMTEDKIQVRKKKGPKARYIWAEFFDHRDQVLFEYSWGLDEIDQVVSKQKPARYIYSFNLEEIPMLILQYTKRIKLIEYQIGYQ